MTEITNPARGVIPASSLILIFLTVGGILLYEKPFKSSRSPESETPQRDDVPPEIDGNLKLD